MDTPADWAIERALAESGNPFLDTLATLKEGSEGVDAVHHAFARYIEAHEQPPVDPDLVTAREICALVLDGVGSRALADDYRLGCYDNFPNIEFALAKLKEARGSGIVSEVGRG